MGNYSDSFDAMKECTIMWKVFVSVSLYIKHTCQEILYECIRYNLQHTLT